MRLSEPCSMIEQTERRSAKTASNYEEIKLAQTIRKVRTFINLIFVSDVKRSFTEIIISRRV